jgi:hypothetical protein
MTEHILCTSAYFLKDPGPQIPGSTSINRYYHKDDYLIVFQPSTNLVHIRRRAQKRGDELGDASGPVRSTDQSNLSMEFETVPDFMEQFSKKAVPPVALPKINESPAVATTQAVLRQK